MRKKDSVEIWPKSLGRPYRHFLDLTMAGTHSRTQPKINKKKSYNIMVHAYVPNIIEK